MNGPDTFGGRLAQARRRLAFQRWEDINDSRLAELLGTTTATVSRWMSGQMPSRRWLEKLEALLGVPARYLEYGGNDLGEPPPPDIAGIFKNEDQVDAERAQERGKRGKGA